MERVQTATPPFPCLGIPPLRRQDQAINNEHIFLVLQERMTSTTA